MIFNILSYLTDPMGEKDSIPAKFISHNQTPSQMKWIFKMETIKGQ